MSEEVVNETPDSNAYYVDGHGHLISRIEYLQQQRENLLEHYGKTDFSKPLVAVIPATEDTHKLRKNERSHIGR